MNACVSEGPSGCLQSTELHDITFHNTVLYYEYSEKTFFLILFIKFIIKLNL